MQPFEQDLYECIDAGFRVMMLHNMVNGSCQCGERGCKAAGKHPKANAWQFTPAQWSDDQLKNLLLTTHTGYGVIIDEHLVIDVDIKNGGEESYAKLCADLGIDFKAKSGYWVQTGGGGFHIYFKRPNLALRTIHKDYPGIDFKSSGFVVGAGSLHSSGGDYERMKGWPSDCTDCPPSLLDLLEKKKTHKTVMNGEAVDISDDEIRELLSYIDPDIDYHDWVGVGMALHHATNGAGLDLWIEWSEKGSKWRHGDDRVLDNKWHGFGKTLEPRTIGTVYYLAQQGGYISPVTFDVELESPQEVADSGIDLTRPPGFVGEIAKWVRGNSDKPTDTIAAASALAIVSNAASLDYVSDDKRPVYGNLFMFCVAGSGVGKQSMLNAVRDAMVHIGYIGAVASGEFKSQQAIVRAMLRHQLTMYLIDEIGLELTKVTGKGSSDYLQGVTKNLMSAFTSSDSVYGVESEVLEAAQQELAKKMGAINKKIDENEATDRDREMLMAFERQMASLVKNGGLEKPFVSIVGYTTPETFDHLVDANNVKQGFFTRSLIFREQETVMRRNKNWEGAVPMPDDIAAQLHSLAANQFFENCNIPRIENYNERKVIPTTPEARALLEEIDDKIYEIQLSVKEQGMESIYNRAYEMILKVSFVLAVAERLRTVEHVHWAYALVMNDCHQKANLAAANIAEEVGAMDEAICRKVLDKLSKKDSESETLGTLINRVRSTKIKPDDIKRAVDILAQNGQIKIEEVPAKRGGITKRLTKLM